MSLLDCPYRKQQKTSKQTKKTVYWLDWLKTHLFAIIEIFSFYDMIWIQRFVVCLVKWINQHLNKSVRTTSVFASASGELWGVRVGGSRCIHLKTLSYCCNVDRENEKFHKWWRTVVMTLQKFVLKTPKQTCQMLPFQSNLLIFWEVDSLIINVFSRLFWGFIVICNPSITHLQSM